MRSKKEIPLLNISRYPIEFSDPRTHSRMLRNKDKYQLFVSALAPLVSGRNVVDVGAGSGILSLICAKLGAKRVFAIERPSVSWITRSVIEQMFPVPNVSIVESDVFDVEDLGQKCDVVLSETLGYLGFEENIVAILAHAKQSFGKTDASVVPRTLSLEMHACTLAPSSENANPFLTTEADEDILQSEGRAKILLGQEFPSSVFTSTCVVSDSAAPRIFNAIGINFIAELVPGCILSNTPPTQWPHCVIPLGREVVVLPGQIVRMSLKSQPISDQFEFKFNVSISNVNFTSKMFHSVDVKIEESNVPEGKSNQSVAADALNLLRILNLEN